MSFLYYLLTQISTGFSAFIGMLIGRPILLGPSYSGVHLVLIFIIVLLFTFKRRALPYLAATLLIWAFYIGLWSVLAEASLTLRLNLLEPLTGPLDYRALLFAMLLAFYLLIRRKAPPLQIKKLWPAAAILLALVIIYALPPARLPQQNGPKQILFWDTGIDFSVPEAGRYGLDNVGMFGMLPHYLTQQGYSCQIVTALDEGLLNESAVLAVFNPMYSLDEDSLAMIWRFVEQGGSVLAVGDHTGAEQVRLPLNAILEPAGISLNFDSAIPFKSLWTDSFRLRKSPLFRGVSDRQIQMVVGASLSVGAKAKPLIIGKEGYADAGDIANVADGYLGDMHFNRGERIGDLILAAEAAYGQGKFLAFGDTSLFQNTVIPYSYPFVNNVFAYLSGGSPGKATVDFIIDASHLEVLGRDKSADAVDGLIACALRAGFLPYLNQNQPLTELLQEAKLLVLVEPAQAFSEAELTALESFMQAGGTVMLCAGYTSPKASIELAQRFGFSFEAMPIGRVAPEQNPAMAFWNACPLLFSQGESLLDIWGYSIIARHGGFYLFADPDFFKNKNIESVDSYREGNIDFLLTLFAELKKGRE